MFQVFNLSRPQDFEGHSLSVSDVIALKRNGEVSVHAPEKLRPAVSSPSRTAQRTGISPGPSTASRSSNPRTKTWFWYGCIL